MARSWFSSLATATAVAMAFPPLAAAQYSGWKANQVNATMCYWSSLRAAQVRDTVYMDGGNMYWVAGLSNGEYSGPSLDGNLLGLIYTLNFSKPFKTTDNMTALFETISTGGGNIAPNFVDGAMLVNDYEFFLYGGLLDYIDTPPEGDSVISYQLYQAPGTDGQTFVRGLRRNKLPTGVTRYVTYGGGASAPSEKKAWYFGGMRSAVAGPIYNLMKTTLPIMPVNNSNYLITLDTSQSATGTWRNDSLPDNIRSRANPELVWVPYGAKGMLVAIGGVLYPEFISTFHNSSNPLASDAQSRPFMSEIDLYDVATGTWYKQPTSGQAPPPLARGCAVVAPAQDLSSVNIYYYGGYNGIDPKSDFNDDVYILSLPSFMWMKISSGKASHGRAGHKCVMPYPDQMVVIGGYASMPGVSPKCVEGGIVQVFNLTSGKWLDSYDPTKWGKYGVPEMIHMKIGGSVTGGATLKSPEATGWATPGLASVFATTYATSSIATYYPYSSVGASNNTNPDLVNGGGGGGGGGVPNWVGPVVGVIGGLILLTSIGVAILVYRRRKLLRRGTASAAGGRGMSEAGTEKSSRIRAWVYGESSDNTNNKEPTIANTEDTPMSPYFDAASPAPPQTAHSATPAESANGGAHGAHAAAGLAVYNPPVEMDNTMVAELPDNSRAFELQDTGLTPVEVITKHTAVGQAYNSTNGGSVHSSGYYSSMAQTDHGSTVSRSSGPSGLRAPPAPASPPLDGSMLGAAAAGAGAGGAILRGGGGYDSTTSASNRLDSPPLGTPRTGTPQQQQQQQQQRSRSPVSRLESGVSGISENERRHLRQISDETVSSFNTSAGVPSMQMQPRPLHLPSRQQQHVVEEAAEDGGDEMTATSAGSPGASTLSPVNPLAVGTPAMVSPPSAGVLGEAADYLSAQGSSSSRQQAQQGQQQGQQGNNTSSPLRRSVFRENEDDMGGRH